MHAQGLPCVLIRSQDGALPSKLGLGGLSSDTQKQACPPRSTPCANLGALPTWQCLEMDRALCVANMRSTDDLPCWGPLGRIRNTRATDISRGGRGPGANTVRSPAGIIPSR